MKGGEKMKNLSNNIEDINLTKEEMDLFTQTKDGKCTSGCRHDWIVGTNTCDAQTTSWF